MEKTQTNSVTKEAHAAKKKSLTYKQFASSGCKFDPLKTTQHCLWLGSGGAHGFPSWTIFPTERSLYCHALTVS